MFLYWTYKNTLLKSSTRINYYIIISRQLIYEKKLSLGPELHSTSKGRVHFIGFPFSEGNFSILRKRNFKMGRFLIGFDGNI